MHRWAESVDIFMKQQVIQVMLMYMVLSNSDCPLPSASPEQADKPYMRFEYKQGETPYAECCCSSLQDDSMLTNVILNTADVLTLVPRLARNPEPIRTWPT